MTDETEDITWRITEFPKEYYDKLKRWHKTKKMPEKPIDFARFAIVKAVEAREKELEG